MRYARPGHLRVSGAGRARVRVPRRTARRATATRRSWRPAPTRASSTTARTRRRMEDGDLLLIDAGCEWGYHSRRHHAHLPGERTLHGRPARDLRNRAARAARRHRGGRPGQPLRGDARRGPARAHRGPRRAGRAAARGRRVARDAPLPRVLHARHRALARHGRARRRRLPDPPPVARARARHGAHRRARPLLRSRARDGDLLPARVQRGGDVGASLPARRWPPRSKIEDEEKAQAPRRSTHPVPRRAPRHRRPHRGRHPDHRRRLPRS